MKLEIIDGLFAVCKLAGDTDVPSWARGNFVSVTRTNEELSIVAPLDCVPEDIQREDGFKLFRISGSLNFSLVGVLARISNVLAGAAISIFVISTFDTDYVLVKTDDFANAKQALQNSGYKF